jgi:hypothetical protein
MLRLFLESPLKEMIGTLILFAMVVPMLAFSVYRGFQDGVKMSPSKN